MFLVAAVLIILAGAVRWGACEGGFTDLDPVTVESIPKSVEEFVQLRDKVAMTPQGGATMMLLALTLYTQDEKVGTDCLTVAIEQDQLDKHADGYKGYRPRNAALKHLKQYIFGEKGYIVRSFFPGTIPENGYTLPPGPWKFTWMTNPHSGSIDSGRIKLFIRSSGSDLPRPMQVKRNDKGIWKAAEWSSFTVSVRKPGKEEDNI
jgi:hypothetical protein